MSKYLKSFKCVRANHNEIYVSAPLGVFGLFLGNAAIPMPLELLATSIIFSLVASCCALNAMIDERMGTIGRTLSTGWLALLSLHILACVAQIAFMPDGPEA